MHRHNGVAPTFVFTPEGWGMKALDRRPEKSVWARRQLDEVFAQQVRVPLLLPAVAREEFQVRIVFARYW